MTTTNARTRRDMEEQIGIDPAEVLHADRRAVLVDLAPLRAKYGPGGTFEARRKAARALYMMEIKADHDERKVKLPGFDLLEMMACADPRYIALLDTAETELVTYHLLEDQMASLTELLNRDQALIRYATSEPKY